MWQLTVLNNLSWYTHTCNHSLNLKFFSLNFEEFHSNFEQTLIFNIFTKLNCFKNLVYSVKTHKVLNDIFIKFISFRCITLMRLIESTQMLFFWRYSALFIFSNFILSSKNIWLSSIFKIWNKCWVPIKMQRCMPCNIHVDKRQLIFLWNDDPILSKT